MARPRKATARQILLCAWVGLLAVLGPAGSAQPVAAGRHPEAAAVEPEEYAVYAAVIAQVHLPEDPKYFLVSERTVGFECDPPASTGLGVGGCSGMRTRDMQPREVLRQLRKVLRTMDATTTEDFEAKNRRSYRLDRELPLPAKHALFAPDRPPKAPMGPGDPDFAAYPSRVGFNRQRTQALIYMGVISWLDASRSVGDYELIRK